MINVEKINMDLVNVKKMYDAGLLSEAEHKKLKDDILNVTARIPEEKDEALADYLSGESKKRHQKWRVPYEEFTLFEKGWMAEARAKKQETFRNLAREGLISPMEVMIGTYVLFGKDKDITFLQSLLVNVSDSKRIQYHNWYVAREWGEAFLQQHGLAITELTTPLFPNDDAFGPQNVRIFRQHESVEGGGEKSTERVVAFGTTISPTAQPTATPQSTTKTIFAGGYPIQVVDGYVDVGVVEDAISWLQTRVTDLETAMRSAKVDPPQAATPQPRNYPQYSRGQSRGRGGGRGHYPQHYGNRGGRGYYQGNY